MSTADISMNRIKNRFLMHEHKCLINYFQSLILIRTSTNQPRKEPKSRKYTDNAGIECEKNLLTGFKQYQSDSFKDDNH